MQMKDIDDDILIQHILNKNRKSQKAFAELIARYGERLYWHIRKIVVSHDDTDDIVQNTFIKAFDKLHLFRGDSKFYTWLYRIGTNEALTQLKKNKISDAISMDDYLIEVTASLDSDAYFTGDEIQQKLQQAIATLPRKQKEVFNLKYFDEMKYEEMSELLQTSVGALKASYHHAVKKIEELLKKEIYQ